MTIISDADKQFSQALAAFKRGKINTTDLALAMTETAGICDRKLYERAGELIKNRK